MIPDQNTYCPALKSFSQGQYTLSNYRETKRSLFRFVCETLFNLLEIKRQKKCFAIHRIKVQESKVQEYTYNVNMMNILGKQPLHFKITFN